MNKKERVVKVGTKDWWTTVAMMRVAEKQRKLKNIPKNEPVKFSVDDINKEIDYLNRHLWKRIWVMITNGNITVTSVDKVLGGEFTLSVGGTEDEKTMD